MTIIRRQEDLPPAVLAVMERTADPRLREIMVSLVRHLYAFVREVRLTEEEFRDATAILNEMGHRSNDTHNETVLMAGSLGVSSLVCLLNNGDHGNTETAQSLLGPFWRLNSPRTSNGGSVVRSDTPGEPLFVSARVQDRDGRPIAGAEVDIWHASPVGLYENQDPEQAEMNLRGKFTTDADGQFSFRSVRMVGYPIPTDGVVGRLLRAQNRHPYRSAAAQHELTSDPGHSTGAGQLQGGTIRSSITSPAAHPVTPQVEEAGNPILRPRASRTSYGIQLSRTIIGRTRPGGSPSNSSPKAPGSCTSRVRRRNGRASGDRLRSNISGRAAFPHPALPECNPRHTRRPAV